MADKKIDIFQQIDLTSNNGFGNTFQVRGYIFPAGWMDNGIIDLYKINGTKVYPNDTTILDDQHNYKLLDSIFIDWNTAKLEKFCAEYNGVIDGNSTRIIRRIKDSLEAVRYASKVAFKSIFSRDAQYTRTIFEDIKRWENVTKNGIPNDRIYNMICPLETSFGINHKSRNYDGKKFIDGFNDTETFFRLQTGFWKNEVVDELSGLKAEFYTKDL